MTTIAQLKDAPDKTMIVEPLRALVVKVQPRRTGEGQYGPWSLQAIELRDNSGSINAVIWNWKKFELESLLNKEIVLGAVKGDNGWLGCIVEDSTYAGKDGKNHTTRQIKASGTYALYGAPPDGNAAPANPSETAPEPSRLPQAAYSAPNWTDYMAVVRSAHALAMELEPDTQIEPNQPNVDRSRARLALVVTILIAYGKRDFMFEAALWDSDSSMPF